MQCSSCGKELTNEDVFCSNCGTAVARQATDSQDVQTILQNTFASSEVQVQPVVQPVVQTVTEPQVQSSTPEVTVAPVNNTNVEVSGVPTNQTEVVSTSLTPPEDKDINQKEEIEYNVGRQTSFVTSDVQSSEPAQETYVAPVQAEASAQPVVQAQPVAVVETPEYQTVTYGPAPIIDPPVVETPVPIYNNAGYNVPNKKGISGGVLVGIIAIVAFVFLAGGIGVGLLLFSSSNSSGKGSGGEVKTDSPAEDLVEVEFAGSKYSDANLRAALIQTNLLLFKMVSGGLSRREFLKIIMIPLTNIF